MIIAITRPVDQLDISRRAAERYALDQALRARPRTPRTPTPVVRRLRHAVAGALLTTARVVDVH